MRPWLRSALPSQTGGKRNAYDSKHAVSSMECLYQTVVCRFTMPQAYGLDRLKFAVNAPVPTFHYEDAAGQ